MRVQRMCASIGGASRRASPRWTMSDFFDIDSFSTKLEEVLRTLKDHDCKGEISTDGPDLAQGSINLQVAGASPAGWAMRNYRNTKCDDLRFGILYI